MNCTTCKARFPSTQRAEAAIAIFVAGNENIFSYWSCAKCSHYTIESYFDSFMGESDISFLPPASKELGERCVALVRACPKPSDKLCGCPSHQALYHGTPEG